MIAAAVIVVPGGGGISPFTRLGGLSLLKRAVLTAQKAGATTCYICPDQEGQAQDELRSELHDDDRVTSRIIWLSTNSREIEAREQAGAEPWLVFSANTVFCHTLIQELSLLLPLQKPRVLVDPAGTPLLALIPRTQVSQLLSELIQGVPLSKTTLRTASDLLRPSLSQKFFVRRLTPASRLAEIEHDLLLSLENPRDGNVDTYFNRKLSRPITRWLLRTPLTPNQITVLSCVVGVSGALCFFPGGYWGPLFGALLLQFSVVLDCCDGEVARVKFMESPLGDWLDIVCDTVVTIAIFLGMGVAVWRDGASHHALVLAGILIVGGFLAFPLVTLAEKTEEAGERRGGWEDVLIKKLLTGLTTRDFSILIVASAVTGKLLWFLWGAAIGAHVFWLSLAWLLFRAGRFGSVRSVWERKGI